MPGDDLSLGDDLLPTLRGLDGGLATMLAKAWTYLNLYLAPFRMPVFFFLSGLLIRRYIADVAWRQCLDKRVFNILYVLVLWGAIQWLCLTQINTWLAPGRDLSASTNAAYASSPGGFAYSLLTASTSLWYLYALIVYFVACKALRHGRWAVLLILAGSNIAINFLPTPWWGINSILRNGMYYALGAYCGQPLLGWITGFPLRRHGLWLAVALVTALALYFSNIALVLALLSIGFFIALFYRLNLRWPVAPNNVLNIVGASTIAIYTTHRILVEVISLSVARAINDEILSDNVTMAILVVYPFVCLIICIAAGLLVRKVSARGCGDWLFNAPKPFTLISPRARS